MRNAKFLVLPGIFILVMLASCDKDPTTIGAGIVGGEPFSTGKSEYAARAFDRKIKAVRTNKLPVYQLGVFNDPIYGKTVGEITTQVQFSAYNPTFGKYSQTVEDGSADDNTASTIQENEQVDSVYLYLPFLQNPTGDRDNDGVADLFDVDPEDANSDTDGDGLTDAQENSYGTDPLNKDTDGDGIPDGQDDDNGTSNQFARVFDLDSIYGVNSNEYETTPFRLKVERSTYFLRDLDPSENFEKAQAYYSSQQFAPDFVSTVLFEGEVTINDREFLFQKPDDPTTTDTDESAQKVRLDPGIRVALDPAFFQENFLDKEGGAELASQAAFLEYFRGIHISLTPIDKDVMVLTNLRAANITVYYHYDAVDTKSSSDTSDDEELTLHSELTLPLLVSQQQSGAVTGNAVNTLINDELPSDIAEQMDTGTNASRIYVKGGAGSYAEIELFDSGDIATIRNNNWIINEANIVFYVDRVALDGKNVAEPPRLYLYNADTGAALYNAANEPQSETVFSYYPQYGGLLETATDGKGIKYTFRITDYINDIIRNDAANATLGLTITPDIRITGEAKAVLNDDSQEEVPAVSTISPLGTVLYGSAVNPGEEAKKMKLEIYYTEVE